MSKPKLLVEALAAGNDSGLGRHVRVFLNALEPLSVEMDIFVILRTGVTYEIPAFLKPLYVQAKPFRLWVQCFFPFLIKKISPRGVLCLGQTLPYFKPRNHYILMIPDIAPVENLSWDTSRYDAYNRQWLKQMPQRANAIITSTEFTKQRMQTLLSLSPDKIHVIPPIYRPYAALEISKKLSDDSPNKPFLLSVGNIEPRKNFPSLLQAYAEAKKKYAALPDLFIIGHKAWGFTALQETLKNLNIQAYVHVQGHVSEDLLAQYYKNCLFFISSSLYEGFGYPLFEALTYGRPAIYHYESSQKEFAGDLAMGIDCASTQALTEAILNLAQDENLRHRYANKTKTEFPKVLQYDLPKQLSDLLRKLLI